MENGILPAMKLFMHSNKLPRLTLFLPASLLLLSMGLCNLPGRSAEATPTPNVTQAYQTVEARLTEAFTQTPATQPVLTNTTAPLPSLTPSNHRSQSHLLHQLQRRPRARPPRRTRATRPRREIRST